MAGKQVRKQQAFLMIRRPGLAQMIPPEQRIREIARAGSP